MTKPKSAQAEEKAFILKRLLKHRKIKNGCWQWTGYLNPGGYANFRIGKKMFKVHRVSYEYFVGQIKERLTLDHLCRNRGCFNPAHLEPVSLAENILRGESPWAKHARTTCCSSGHAYSRENTRINPRGSRCCRMCETLRTHKRRIARQRALLSEAEWEK